MASTIKVNNIQNQCGANIANKCGSTITLGASGDTITLACGASQTGFGRTGTVDWDTTPKTASFTAVNGTGYFVNTTSGAITMTMPSGSAGAIVSIQDYNKTFDTNALTVTPASGEKINGGTADGPLVVGTEGQGLTFIYVDSTVGWKTVHENEFTSGGSSFMVATGGTVTTCGDYKIHTFTGPGTFCVSGTSPCASQNVVSYMVVAGGGAGGGSATGDSDSGGGGGAGGFREYKNSCDPYTASPLNGNPGGTAVTVTTTSYPITVGGGGSSTPGAPGSGIPTAGSNSVFSTVTSAGGGTGGQQFCSAANGGPGGSGGGGTGSPGGTGNTPPVTPAQGTNGGTGSGAPTKRAGGGGGGATAAGGDFTPTLGGPGGTGATTSISGTPTAYAGGGGGGGQFPQPGTNGGTGGGGPSSQGCAASATNGTANTGGGGGGNGRGPAAPGVSTGGDGGSGIVIIRYKYQ